jgi:hypothetical protein
MPPKRLESITTLPHTRARYACPNERSASLGLAIERMPHLCGPAGLLLVLIAGELPSELEAERLGRQYYPGRRASATARGSSRSPRFWWPERLTNGRARG